VGEYRLGTGCGTGARCAVSGGVRTYRRGDRVVSGPGYVRGVTHVDEVDAQGGDAGDGGAAAPGRLVLLTTSHRVAPGQLSWPAWRTLHDAARVLCPDPEHPHLPYLREAGVAVEVADPGGQELVDATAGGRTVVYLPPSGGAAPAVTDELSRLGGSGRVAMPDLESR
jgi:hypothetical protein